MRKKRIIMLLSAIIVVEIVCITGIFIKDGRTQPMPNITMRHIDPQTVLYTVFRGHYNEVGPAISQLYELAGAKGLTPIGPAATGYLNNPQLVSPEHWLIEIRIPVSEDAMQHAGKLGRMTDVKLLPAMNVAAVVKPEGEHDPEQAIRSLYAWIDQRGYRVAGGLWQTVLDAESEDYSLMRTEFMIPIYYQTAVN